MANKYESGLWISNSASRDVWEGEKAGEKIGRKKSAWNGMAVPVRPESSLFTFPPSW